MVGARTETPLRRSVLVRESFVRADMTPINDDDEERRQARRRTLLQSVQALSTNETTSIEDNETLKQCMEIYNGNKLSRDNAWSLSLIDTLSSLMQRHHKSLNNFKVAGSSLEASSKVYGLRVDSIYTDVLRMSAGLSAKKYSEKPLNDDEDDANAAAGKDNENGAAADDNAAASAANGGAGAIPEKQKPKKRARKVVSTVTKNKDTLNARLDTVPMQDPVFGKLNTIVGSINASNRLMNNMLPTTESELRLRTNYRFWDASEMPAHMDFAAEVCMAAYTPADWMNAEWLLRLKDNEQLLLRPMHSGYIVSDAPIPTNNNAADVISQALPALDGDFDDGSTSHPDDLDLYLQPKELSMAFDMNAECEPMPELDAHAAVLEVDYNELDEMTNDERTALHFCRGLRKKPVVIDDLRPVDATSKLEYSYRPIDNISQFWAGPSHWKFKRPRPRSTTLAQQASNVPGSASGTGGRSKRAQQLQARRRCKQLNFGECHDELFIKLDKNTKLRKANFQKKWDPRKLKLPTNLKINKDLFFKYEFAPGLRVRQNSNYIDDDDDDDCAYVGGGDEDDEVGCAGGGMLNTPNFDVTGGNLMGVSSLLSDSAHNELNGLPGAATLHDQAHSMGNDTVLEIATDFAGAPMQVTKVIVPFARRAKIIDMKNLKLCCSQLISKELKATLMTSSLPVHPMIGDEHYVDGMASFSDVYEQLPEILTPAMSEALSPAVALYSVLHLANELNLRLIPEPDLEDFKIRQVLK